MKPLDRNDQEEEGERKVKVALFGLGYFGEAHARTLKRMGVLDTVVDINREKEGKAREEFGANFFSDDFTKTLVLDYCDEMGSAAFYPSIVGVDKANIPGALLKCDAWDIATNVPSHFALAMAAINLGKRVFVEKPTCTGSHADLDTLERASRGCIAEVDYLEVVHPAVRAIREEMQREGVPLTDAFHRRSKDLSAETKRGSGGGRGSRIVQDDLVHDISEILSLLPKNVAGSVRIKSASLQAWSSLGSEFSDIPGDRDVRATLVLDWDGCNSALIKGGFADPEVRAFVVGNYEKGVAWYGNTLTRQHIKPAAAFLRGNASIKKVVEAVLEGRILTQEDQDRILTDVKARLIPVTQEGPLDVMLEGFLRAERSEDLRVGVSLAVLVERVASSAYNYR